MEYKDYYKSLGVLKGASKDDIRKAFRKLARKYHPDVSRNDPGAEDKFKEINEAYEVLSDPEKRQKYDTLGSNWQQGGGFRPPPGWQGRGAGRTHPDFDLGGTGFSDFFEQFFSGERGHSPFGGGRQRQARGNDVQADIMVTLEEVVNGSIRSITLRDRGGSGAPKQFKVKIPKGVADGQKLRLAGKGERGHGGSSAGDLFLIVRYARHPDFKVKNGNLLFDLALAPWDAVLGGQLQVPTLHGHVQIRIPAGSQNGQKLRLKGKGLPSSDGREGDLHVQLKVDIPKSISSEEKELWEKLRQTSSFQPGQDR